jgi:hypothetical protein
MKKYILIVAILLTGCNWEPGKITPDQITMANQLCASNGMIEEISSQLNQCFQGKCTYFVKLTCKNGALFNISEEVK